MSLLRHQQLLMKSGSYKGAVIIAQSTTPYARAFRWSDDDGFGAEYSAPSVSLGEVGYVTFTEDRRFVFFAHALSPGITAFEWDDDTGFGAAYQPSTALPSGTKTGLSVNPAGGSVVVCHSSSPYISAYEWNPISGFGAKYANPATVPAGSANEVRFHPSGGAIALGIVPDPRRYVYRWDNSTGFGTTYTPPGPIASSTCYGVDWNPDGSELALGSAVATSQSTPSLRTYPFDLVSGFGTASSVMLGNNPGPINYAKYSPNGAALAAAVGRSSVNCRVVTSVSQFDVAPFTGGARYCTFSPGGKVLAIGGSQSPYAAFYRWDDVTGFGAQFPLPVTLTGTILSIAFSGER